mmetsp:Transcript_47586/g.152496  ORF Transcript_47586/g.152496 Transcript_47586/m.152496 type:complete len:240 (+) Transcript_47586:155-874(+)
MCPRERCKFGHSMAFVMKPPHSAPARRARPGEAAARAPRAQRCAAVGRRPRGGAGALERPPLRAHLLQAGGRAGGEGGRRARVGAPREHAAGGLWLRGAGGARHRAPAGGPHVGAHALPRAQDPRRVGVYVGQEGQGDGAARGGHAHPAVAPPAQDAARRLRCTELNSKVQLQRRGRGGPRGPTRGLRASRCKNAEMKRLVLQATPPILRYRVEGVLAPVLLSPTMHFARLGILFMQTS